MEIVRDFNMPAVLPEYNLHQYHIAHRSGADAKKKVSFPYMQCGDDGNADKLRCKGGERCKLYFFEAIYDENGNDR